jgi:hypothetical protein
MSYKVLQNCVCVVCCNRTRYDLTYSSGKTFVAVPAGWTENDDGTLTAPDGTVHVPHRSSGWFTVGSNLQGYKAHYRPGDDLGPPNPPVKGTPNPPFYHTFFCSGSGNTGNSVTYLIPGNTSVSFTEALAKALAVLVYAPAAAAQLNCGVETCAGVIGTGVYNTEALEQQCSGGYWYSSPWTVPDGWSVNVNPPYVLPP